MYIANHIFLLYAVVVNTYNMTLQKRTIVMDESSMTCILNNKSCTSSMFSESVVYVIILPQVIKCTVT